MLPTVPNSKKWPSVFLGVSMEGVGNGWVLGQLVRVGSEIPLGVLGLEECDWQFGLHSADLARLDLPKCTVYEEESPFYS